MQTIVLYLCYIVLILLFSTAYNTSLIYCFVVWCLHTNKRRPCSSTLSGHPSSSSFINLLVYVHIHSHTYMRVYVHIDVSINKINPGNCSGSYCHLDHAPRVADRRFHKRPRDKITASLQTLLRLPVDLEPWPYESWSVSRLVGWLVGWWVGCLVGWLVGWWAGGCELARGHTKKHSHQN